MHRLPMHPLTAFASIDCYLDWLFLEGSYLTSIESSNIFTPSNVYNCGVLFFTSIDRYSLTCVDRSELASIQRSGHYKASTSWWICIWLHHIICSSPGWHSHPILAWEYEIWVMSMCVLLPECTVTHLTLLIG